MLLSKDTIIVLWKKSAGGMMGLSCHVWDDSSKFSSSSLFVVWLIQFFINFPSLFQVKTFGMSAHRSWSSPSPRSDILITGLHLIYVSKRLFSLCKVTFRLTNPSAPPAPLSPASPSHLVKREFNEGMNLNFAEQRIKLSIMNNEFPHNLLLHLLLFRSFGEVT